MTFPPIRQALAPGLIPRHRHAAGYVAVVLAGGYEEAGDSGLRRLVAGDVVVHRPWEAHLDRAPAAAEVLNLPLPAAEMAPFGRIEDLDALVRAAAADPQEAARLLAEDFEPLPASGADWPHRLAGELAMAAPATVSLEAWAETFGVSREQLSRGFRRVFGVTPQRFRWEARTRAALRDLVHGGAPLAEVALTHGFADQAHMTRAIRDFSGRTPGAWRRSNPFKTRAEACAI